jgi:hypothetical protein
MGLVSIRTSWNGTQIPLGIADRFFSVNIMPSADFPFGERGRYMARAWQMLNSGPVTYGYVTAGNACGMLLLDGDVAIDPWDYDIMLDAIRDDPGYVHVAPLKLWPVSTRSDGWVWGHGFERFRNTQPDVEPNLFTFGFTYLPAVLIEKCIKAGMKNWVYPDVDTQVCMQAMKMELYVNIVEACQPKHMNY